MKTNPIIEDLHHMCYMFGKDNPKVYYAYKDILLDTLYGRSYSFCWKFKYFCRLVVWKVIKV